MHLSVDNMHFRAVVVVDASKLQPDVASSNDGQLFGQAGEVEDVVRDDGVLRTLDWQLHCSPSCGYEDDLSLHSHSWSQGQLLSGQNLVWAELSGW